jgi:hypothetical protein
MYYSALPVFFNLTLPGLWSKSSTTSITFSNLT